MLKTIRLSPFLKKTVGTIITSVLTIVCLVIMTSALAKGLGPEKFGAFSLIKRILNTMEPWVTVSLGISVARFVALSKSPATQLNYFRTGFIILTATLIVTLGIGALFPLQISHLIFNSDGYTSVYFAMLFLIFCYSYYVLLYAYYRGLGDMWSANIWQTVVVAVGPMLIALSLAHPGNLELIVYLNAFLLGLGIFPLVKHLKMIEWITHQKYKLESSARELLRYGLPRVPGSLIYGGILAAGPMGATYLGSLKDAGYLVIGQSLLKIYEGGIEGFTRVAMPAISLKFSESGKEGLRDRITDLISIIFDMGLFLTLHNFVWAFAIVELWLGEGYGGAVLPVQVMTLSLCPYLSYVTLRAVLDAVEERALTTRYLFVSLIIMIVASLLFTGLGVGPIGFAIATAISFYALGILASRRVCSDFDITFKSIVNIKVVGLNVVLVILALMGKYFFHDAIDGKILKVGALVVIEGICFLIYLFVLSRLNLGWFNSILSRISFNKS